MDFSKYSTIRMLQNFKNRIKNIFAQILIIIQFSFGQYISDIKELSRINILEN